MWYNQRSKFRNIVEENLSTFVIRGVVIEGLSLLGARTPYRYRSGIWIANLVSIKIQICGTNYDTLICRHIQRHWLAYQLINEIRETLQQCVTAISPKIYTPLFRRARRRSIHKVRVKTRYGMTAYIPNTVALWPVVWWKSFTVLMAKLYGAVRHRQDSMSLLVACSASDNTKPLPEPMSS